MKFGKEFKKQKVPEWTEAYMDYNGLKRILRKIIRFKQSNQPSTPSRVAEQRLTLDMGFTRLTQHPINLQGEGDIEDQVIAVNRMQQEGSVEFYNTMFLKQYEEGGENEVLFFRKLDQELNKVNSFYRDTVEAVMHEAALLDKQMDVLIALRIKVENPDFDGSSLIKLLSADIASMAPSTITSPSIDGDPEMEHVGVTIGVEMRDGCHQDESTGSQTGTDHVGLTRVADRSRTYELEESISSAEVNALNTTGCSICREENINLYRQSSLDILDRVKIRNPLETPISTIKGVLKDSKEQELSFKKVELRRVEERLKLVFVEFYQKLRLLKHYSFMNLSAFSKIMKKYEKITSRGAYRPYMKIVDNSYLGNSDEVTNLLERVESTFIKHFANSNHREGMKSLRSKAKREKHSIAFFSGFFSGFSIALLVAIVLTIGDRNLMEKEEAIFYMENILPLYSLFAYIVLHMLTYAANIYFWRLYGVNYPFIFGFKHGTELAYREVFLISTGLAVLAQACFLANLHMALDSRTPSYVTVTEMVPLCLITVVLFITFCPFNIIYRSSRFFLIHCVLRCICAPLYKVTLPDFFLADQLTSQVHAIRNFELYICYYSLHEFSRRHNKCHRHGVYNAFYFIVAVVPYWLRFLQCLRRLFEEKDSMHGYNGLKYFLTIVAVVMRTAFELRKGVAWKVLALVTSAIATIMNTYWDIIFDWGLLQRQSKNFYLRDKLLVSHKVVYFAAMVLNVLLRFAWLQSVLEFNVHSLPNMALSTIVSCLEILRRGIWNFFRLENEHLNNVGKYRAFRSVPLPFHYYDEDIDKED